jgi:Mrp family chromosome partitioning ATPase
MGLAAAAAGKRVGQVLLIDGNCHRPGVCTAFGVSAEGGLGDLVAGAMNADAVIKKTAVPDLSVMGVGVMPGDHIRVLAPPKFLSCLEQLTSNFQFILVDGPAVNPFPESTLYASSVDRVLLVVHAGVTRSPVVAKALARLSAAGCEKVDIILNRRTFAIPQAIYKRL